MALPSSGMITTQQISQELYGNTTTRVDLTGADARALAGKSTGTIVLPNDFWGKSLAFDIIVGTPATGDTWGYIDTPSWVWGTISPENATCYPDGRTAIVGAKGHIFSLSYSLNAPHYGGLYLRIGGTTTDWPNVSSLPFNSIKIGSTTFNKSVLTFSGAGDHGSGVPIVEYKIAQDVNPFVRGDNLVQFLP